MDFYGEKKKLKVFVPASAESEQGLIKKLLCFLEPNYF